MCIHESVVIDHSQKIQAFNNVTLYRMVNIYRLLKSGFVCVVRLKHQQPLFGLLDIYLRVHPGKRPLGKSRRMLKGHIQMQFVRYMHGVEFF